MECGDGGFEAVFREDYPSAVRAVTWIVGDVEQAREIAQDAFALLLVRWRRAVRYDRPGAWARRVAIRDAVRAAGRRRRVIDAEAVWERTRSPADRRSIDIDLARAVLELTPMQRACVVLHYLEDRPVAEVARLLSCSEGSVKTHLHRGRTRLAVLLGDSEEEHADAH